MSAPFPTYIRPNKYVFHGAHGEMNNLYDSGWSEYTKKMYDTPYKLELLAQSLSEAKYGGTISQETKEFFMILYSTIPRVSAEAYSKQALASITVIRHDVKSNNCKWMKLGCKKCGLIIDPLYFASGVLPRTGIGNSEGILYAL